MIFLGGVVEPSVKWSAKQIEFCHAMTAYETQPIYGRINRFVAWANVSLQWVLVGLALWSGLPWYGHVLMILVAFVVADFINGLVHFYMDHNDAYGSRVGPFIATFHLHHDTPRYQEKSIGRVYVDESGYKIWLIFVLIFAVAATLVGWLPSWFVAFFAYFGVFSSLAEVSHFLCHNRSAGWVLVLQRCWILLPKQHHMQHHRLDNVNYAFLNGMSDGVINAIARRIGSGYRETTDEHTALYQWRKAAEV
jgi:hypothetical protein